MKRKMTHVLLKILLANTIPKYFLVFVFRLLLHITEFVRLGSGRPDRLTTWS